MRIVLRPQRLRTLLVAAVLVEICGAVPSRAAADFSPGQVVITPAAADTIGPARNWDRVDPAYRYYRGPNYRYDAGWYGQRHLADPNHYVAYASDPASVCDTEYYYMPDDGVYYCYTPDPVALNSNLQTGCPNQPYLYFCPNDLR